MSYDDAKHELSEALLKADKKREKCLMEGIIKLSSELLGEELNPVTYDDFESIKYRVNALGYDFRVSPMLYKDIYTFEHGHHVMQGEQILTLEKVEEDEVSKR